MFSFLDSITRPVKLYLTLFLLISAMAGSSWLTWQVSQKQIAQERLEWSKSELVAEKAATAYWMAEVNMTQQNAMSAAQVDEDLDSKINKILEQTKHAKPLPVDCVIDDDGLRRLEAAREAANTAASGSKPSN